MTSSKRVSKFLYQKDVVVAHFVRENRNYYATLEDMSTGFETGPALSRHYPRRRRRRAFAAAALRVRGLIGYVYLKDEQSRLVTV